MRIRNGNHNSAAKTLYSPRPLLARARRVLLYTRDDAPPLSSRPLRVRIRGQQLLRRAGAAFTTSVLDHKRCPTHLTLFDILQRVDDQDTLVVAPRVDGIERVRARVVQPRHTREEPHALASCDGIRLEYSERELFGVFLWREIWGEVHV